MPAWSQPVAAFSPPMGTVSRRTRVPPASTVRRSLPDARAASTAARSGRPTRGTPDGFATTAPAASRTRKNVSDAWGSWLSDTSPSLRRHLAAELLELDGRRGPSARSTSWSRIEMPTIAVAAPTARTRAPITAMVPRASRRRVRARSAAFGPRTAARVTSVDPQRVPDTAHRPQQAVPLELGELPPEVADVQVDDVRVDVRLRSPDRVEDLLPRDDPTLVADEVGEQRELAGRQVDGPRRRPARRGAPRRARGRRPRAGPARRRPAAGRGRGCGRAAPRRRTACRGSRRPRRRARRPARSTAAERGQHEGRRRDAAGSAGAGAARARRGRAASGRARARRRARRRRRSASALTPSGARSTAWCSATRTRRISSPIRGSSSTTRIRIGLILAAAPRPVNGRTAFL